ncbi:unnamed protein product [Cunninghamella blakesleeana]
MLTFGQASCLILGLPPTNENRKIAKEKMKKINMEPTYLDQAHQSIPTAIAKNVMELNPFLYRSYPETTPPSPKNSAASIKSEAEPSSTTLNNFEEISMNKQTAIQYLKSILFLNEPQNLEMFDHLFITNDILMEIVKEHFGEFQFKRKQVILWINECNVWGSCNKKRDEGK